MKKMFLFFSGVITGIFLTFGYAFVVKTYLKPKQEITLFEEPKHCLTRQNLTVFQVVEPDFALTHGKKDLIVALTNYEGNLYFDGEVVQTPKGKCFRQIGVYKYLTQEDNYKTIPIVAIEE
mgnify:CR=1 FL=1